MRKLYSYCPFHILQSIDMVQLALREGKNDDDVIYLFADNQAD
jgi:hypothetical protein